MDRILGNGDYIILGSSHPLSGSICQVTDARNPNYILVRLWIKAPHVSPIEPNYHYVEFMDIIPYPGDETELEARICLTKL